MTIWSMRLKNQRIKYERIKKISICVTYDSCMYYSIRN